MLRLSRRSSFFPSPFMAVMFYLINDSLSASADVLTKMYFYFSQYNLKEWPVVP